MTKRRAAHLDDGEGADSAIGKGVRPDVLARGGFGGWSAGPWEPLG